MEGWTGGKDRIWAETTERTPYGADGRQRSEKAAIDAREPGVARPERRGSDRGHGHLVGDERSKVPPRRVRLTRRLIGRDHDVPAEAWPVSGERERPEGAPVRGGGEVPREEEERTAGRVAPLAPAAEPRCGSRPDPPRVGGEGARRDEAIVEEPELPCRGRLLATDAGSTPPRRNACENLRSQRSRLCEEDTHDPRGAPPSHSGGVPFDTV